MRFVRSSCTDTFYQWAADIGVPAYAIDEQTALKVVDGVVKVVSEGHWKLFTPEQAVPK